MNGKQFRRGWWRCEDAVGDAAVWLGNRDLMLPAMIALAVGFFVLGAVLF